MKTLTILSLCALLGLTACGSGKNTAETPDEAALEVAARQNSRLAEALNDGHLDKAGEMADSMSLFVDDLTPEQTVQVLMAFLQIHNNAVEKKESRRDLETLRKYVDVYDIALSVNPRDTREAFEKAHRVNPAVDFDSIAAAFRERLTQYDAVQDGSLNAPETAEADSTATDSLQTVEEIPLELRPAE
ncbi:MAG: hypothetical protein NC339_03495 [Muribaculaceae bacterium]|nr:hypothetical protein [Muribaculaceae bacterium]